MILKQIEIYHPDNAVTNEYYLERFQDKQEMFSGMFKSMGLESRYIVNDGEDNSLSMAKKAVEKLLSSTDINREEIGGVFYVSQTPEYLIPTNAVLLHQAFELSKDCICVDSNANCAGMATVFESVYHYFKAHEECKYILLVGSELSSRHASKDCMISYGTLGDVGCAVLLERSEGGFLDSMYYTNSKNADSILFPKSGTSNLHEKDSDKHIYWGLKNGTVEGTFGPGVTRIKLLLEKHGIDKEEIGLVCCNQQAKPAGEFIVNELGLSEDKTCFIGNCYAYTGSTAAFISLYHGLKEGCLKHNQYIVFCCAGAGGTLSVILYRYMEEGNAALK